MYLEGLINLRNNFILTHGDVRFNLEIIEDIELNILQFITAIEVECNQVHNNWNVIIDKLIEFCSFNVSEELKNVFTENLLLTVTKDSTL